MAKTHFPNIRIGTSNWNQSAIRATLPKARLGPGKMLEAYATFFPTVEINSTFYRFHQAKTFSSWAKKVPQDFEFAIKANRLFTHDRGLAQPHPELRTFLLDILSLGEHLGPILFQLPASTHADAKALRSFLRRLKSLSPIKAGHPVSFELRHPSWHTPEVYRILEKAEAGFCIFDIRQKPSPMVVTSSTVYIRLHGPLKRPYLGRYGTEALEIWAERIAGWSAKKLDVYVYFDNTQFGDAVPDAVELAKILRLRERRTLKRQS